MKYSAFFDGQVWKLKPREGSSAARALQVNVLCAAKREAVTAHTQVRRGCVYVQKVGGSLTHRQWRSDLDLNELLDEAFANEATVAVTAP